MGLFSTTIGKRPKNKMPEKNTVNQNLIECPYHILEDIIIVWPVCHLADLIHLDVVFSSHSVLVPSVPGEVVDSKTVAPRPPPLAAEAENW